VLAHPFDPERGVLTGDPVPFPVMGNALGQVQLSASTNGAAVYRPASLSRELVWVDRQGQRLSTAAPAGLYDNIALSPDGKRVAFDRFAEVKQDVWVLDLERQFSSRFTTARPLNARW